MQKILVPLLLCGLAIGCQQAASTSSEAEAPATDQTAAEADTATTRLISLNLPGMT